MIDSLVFSLGELLLLDRTSLTLFTRLEQIVWPEEWTEVLSSEWRVSMDFCSHICNLNTDQSLFSIT